MVQTKPNILEEFWKGYTAKIQAEVSLVNARIAHQGERGGANENILIDLLKGFLPKKYGVSSGFVIDPDGECSKQTDIILYDNQFNPDLMEYKGGSIVPVDWTYAVIEVKTTLKGELENAINNIAKTKSLKWEKCLEPVLYKNKKNPGWGGRMTSSPIGVIFAYQSGWKNPTTIKKNIEKCLEKVDKRLHPNIICCIMDGYISYYQKYPIESKKSQNIQHWIYLLPGTETGTYIKIEVKPRLDYGSLFPINGSFYPVSKYKKSVHLADSPRTLLHLLLLLNHFISLKTIISDLNIRTTYLPDSYKHALPL